MAEKGIIFAAPMVRALLDGRKTQTRRLLSLGGYRGFTKFGPSDTPGYDWHFRRADGAWCDVREDRLRELLPYAPGDRLYVREAFSYDTLDVDRDGTLPPWYWADGNIPDAERGSSNFTKPKPSIHMPRWASRLTLLVTDVRVQRVAEISEEDAIAEGADYSFIRGAAISQRRMFELLWNSLHDRPGQRWEDNPWVVAVSFDVKHGNIDRINR
ncbi:hypothetical protein NCF86_03635 [Pelagerythrobacter marinus]|nr:hypothetical protein NCF86_03635 [Pelagerythrobacter marinus]